LRNGWGNKGRLIALLMAFTLVFVAGCQAVSGVDFNKVLKNAIKVTSSESTQTIEFKLQLDEQLLEELPLEEQGLIKLFATIKLQLDQVLMQDADHLSLNGSLTLGNAKRIGFSLQMSDEQAVMTLDGAKQPFVLDMTSEGLLGMAGLEAETEPSSLDQATLTSIGHELIDTVSTFIIDNLPNAERLTVKPTVESINGESVSLMHVHIDLDGPELWTLVNKYVAALVADRAGLENMINGIFDIFEKNPDLWAAFGEVNPFEDPELDAPTMDETKATAAEEIAGLLVELQESLQSMPEDDPELINDLLSKDLVIQADVYVDSKLDIRKQQLEVNYTFPELDLGLTPEEMEEQQVAEEEGAYEDDYDYEYDESYYSAGPGIKGFTLKVTNESWNVNGAVTAVAPAAPAGAVAVDELLSMQGYKVLKQFEESSVMYDLLKNQFELNKQTVSWYPFAYGNPAIITPSYITIIPLRDTADELGATLTYDKLTKSMKLYDEATDTTINLKLGSNKATVNGKAVQWSFPVTVIDGVTYVPARDLAKALQAKISWTEYFEDVKVFVLEREL
jgi:hypothetical protein